MSNMTERARAHQTMKCNLACPDHMVVPMSSGPVMFCRKFGRRVNAGEECLESQKKVVP